MALSYTGNLGLPFVSIEISHLWTLATEEQFYLIFPFVLWIVMRNASLKRFFPLLAVGSLLIVLLLGSFIESVEALYAFGPTWAPSLLIGVLAKVHENYLKQKISARSLGWFLGLALAAMCFVPLDKGIIWLYVVFVPMVSTLSAILIVRLASSEIKVSVLLKPLQGLGVVSYAAYLWNWQIVQFIGAWDLGLFGSVAAFALTISFAIASWYLIEKPMTRFKVVY